MLNNDNESVENESYLSLSGKLSSRIRGLDLEKDNLLWIKLFSSLDELEFSVFDIIQKTPLDDALTSPMIMKILKNNYESVTYDQKKYTELEMIDENEINIELKGMKMGSSLTKNKEDKIKILMREKYKEFITIESDIKIPNNTKTLGRLIKRTMGKFENDIVIMEMIHKNLMQRVEQDSELDVSFLDFLISIKRSHIILWQLSDNVSDFIETLDQYSFDKQLEKGREFINLFQKIESSIKKANEENATYDIGLGKKDAKKHIKTEGYGEFLKMKLNLFEVLKDTKAGIADLKELIMK